MNSLSFRPPRPVPLQRQLLTWWYGLPQPLRSRAVPAGLAALTIVGLLLSFHHVVSMSVKQGELLRMSTATHEQAVWRCQALHSARTRVSCMEQLNTPPVAAETPPPNLVTMQVAER